MNYVKLTIILETLNINFLVQFYFKLCHLIYPAGTRHGEVFRLELSPSILELCDRAATKVVWVTVSVAARSANIVVPRIGRLKVKL